MTLRGRLTALGIVLVVGFGGGIVELVRTRTPDCTIAAPRPALPAALRALGDFDQAYPAGDAAALEDAAARAASALHADLIGTSPQSPVAVAAADPAAPDALVVALRSAAATTSDTPPLAGLVVFLLDCQSNAYFDSVEDVSTAQPPMTSFPPVGRSQAAVALGSTSPRLEYRASPLQPLWVTTSGPAQSLPAG